MRSFFVFAARGVWHHKSLFSPSPRNLISSFAYCRAGVFVFIYHLTD